MSYPAQPPQTPPPFPQPATPNFGIQAARASWIAPIIGVALDFVANSAKLNMPPETAILGLTSFLIHSLGLILGIVALTKIPRFGPRGILAPALIGIVINGFFVALYSLLLVVAFNMHQ